MASKWLAYFGERQKRVAISKGQQNPLDYGDIIYTSPAIDETRWIVTKYKDEYNVFIEKVQSRLWGASFTIKDRAMAFALKMYLVCGGKIKLKDRHNL